MSNAYTVVRPDCRSARYGQVRTESQHLLHRGDGPAGGFAGNDVGQVLPDPEPQQPVAHELAGGEPATLLVGQLPGPDHQLEGHLLRHGVTVGSLPERAACVALRCPFRRTVPVGACVCQRTPLTHGLFVVYNYPRGVAENGRPCISCVP